MVTHPRPVLDRNARDTSPFAEGSADPDVSVCGVLYLIRTFKPHTSMFDERIFGLRIQIARVFLGGFWYRSFLTSWRVGDNLGGSILRCWLILGLVSW